MYEPTEMVIRIKTAAKVNGIKLGDMWRDLNLTNNTLHNMNNGSMPSIGTLMRIAQYVGVPSDYIIGEKIKNAPCDTAESNESINTVMSEAALREILNQMSESDVDALLDYARYLLWKHNQVT